ncbi:hypothetical protein [Yoonia sp. SDW83-1]|uniref:hypothetical protein n=1 Tax=Yoonia sp. SDW83-1 TaxID=3366945 RepID=UPI00398C2EF7
MNRVNMLAAFAASSVLLAGCSNDDGGGSTTPDYTSFAEIEPDAAAMQSSYTDSNGALLMGITPATAMDIPDSGSATYNGFIGGEIGGSDLIGQLTINAAFAAGDGSITSSATGFFHETDGAYTGTLTGTGILVQDPPMGVSQVQTDIDGTLSNGGTDYVTAIALEGSIIANGADPIGAIAGTADGNVGGNFLDDGVFSAER